MDFIKGMELSERYFKEVIYEILKRDHSKLRYTAGLIGAGSEVLGFDTERSMDHDWGPRLMIFLNPEDYFRHTEIQESLQNKLPKSFLGFPTNFRKEEGGKVSLLSHGCLAIFVVIRMGKDITRRIFYGEMRRSRR